MNPHLNSAAVEYLNEYAQFLEDYDPYYQHEDHMPTPAAYIRARMLNDMAEVIDSLIQP